MSTNQSQASHFAYPADGRYAGFCSHGAEPEGSIAVSSAPEHADQIFDFAVDAWISGGQWLVSMLCAQIDAAADKARAAVVGDPLRAVEYQRAAEEAAEFKAAGYPANFVPPMVDAWAVNGRTPEAAADNILDEAAAYNSALVSLRRTRLAAKEQVRVLVGVGQAAEARLLSNQTVQAIESAIAGIGNNAGAVPA